MNKKSQLIKKLNTYYPNIQFEIIEEEYVFRLLHNCFSLRNDKNFIFELYKLSLEFTTKEEQMNFSVLYDYFNELKDVNSVELDLNGSYKSNIRPLYVFKNSGSKISCDYTQTSDDLGALLAS